jgi:hypothetical protein
MYELHNHLRVHESSSNRERRPPLSEHSWFGSEHKHATRLVSLWHLRIKLVIPASRPEILHHIPHGLPSSKKPKSDHCLEEHPETLGLVTRNYHSGCFRMVIGSASSAYYYCPCSSSSFSFSGSPCSGGCCKISISIFASRLLRAEEMALKRFACSGPTTLVIVFAAISKTRQRW